MLNNLPFLLAIVLLIAAVKLFLDHRKAGYEGEFKANGAYPNISTTKHDVMKIFFITLFPALVYGLGDQKLLDLNNILDSWVGRTGVLLAGFFIYHELVQPYVVAKLPSF